MSDAVKELGDLIRACNARVTFDLGRDIRKACTFCGEPADPAHELRDIGRYANGDLLTRPVCAECQPIADAKGFPR